MTIRAAGPPDVLAAFIVVLRTELPPAARITSFRDKPAAEIPPLPPTPEMGFLILDTEAAADELHGGGHARLALCDDCRR